MSDEVTERLVGMLERIYQPRPTMTPWEWAEANVILSPRESIDHPGPFRSDQAPQNRWLMEQAVDPDVAELFITKSSQSGVTLSMLLVIMHMVATQPRNLIYCIDSQSEVMKISRVRLQPMLRACAATACQISEDEDQTNLTMYLQSMIIYMIGSYSSGALANKTAGLVILDELDKHPPLLEGEGTTVDLARDRLKNVRDGKLIGFSTPTTRAGQVWREYERGTMHQCFVPCPSCDHMQPLVWERVRFAHCKDLAREWDYEKVRLEAYYECEMGCRIEEGSKRQMIRGYEWRPTNPRPKPRRVTALQSDLYSLFPGAGWGVLACEWLDAQGDPAKIETFYRSRLGIAPKEVANELSEDQVLACRGAYRRGQMVIEPLLLGMAVDVQGDCQKWARLAFSERGDMYVVDYGATLVMEELAEIADEPLFSPAGHEYVVQAGLIDEGDGNRTSQVRRFCLTHAPRFFPTKGRGGIQVRHTVGGSPATVDGEEIMVYHFDDRSFKTHLYIGMIRHRERAIKYDKPRLFLPADVEAEFVAELRSEALVKEKDKRGYVTTSWKHTKSVPNDFGDVLKMGLVLWSILGPQLQATWETPEPLTPAGGTDGS